jgi:hypothetical protein
MFPLGKQELKKAKQETGATDTVLPFPHIFMQGARWENPQSDWPYSGRKAKTFEYA